MLTWLGIPDAVVAHQKHPQQCQHYLQQLNYQQITYFLIVIEFPPQFE